MTRDKDKDAPHLTWHGKGRFYTESILPVELKLEKNQSLESKINEHLIIEGDNLGVMSALLDGRFQQRGKIDLLLWDPPYNTGNKDFRYRDDYSLNKQELNQLTREHEFKAGKANGWVSITDPSKHTKWLNFMAIRLWYGRKLLKENGVIAICIDYHELFRLGMLMDQIFGEDNRLGIINWQRRYSPSNDSKHLSPTTEYVLIYAKNETRAKTGLLERTDKMNAKYGSPDGDPELWRSSDPAAKTYNEKDDYGIQNPFTGEVLYPSNGSSWRYPKDKMKKWLKEWGSEYIEKVDPNHPKHPNKALMIKGDLKKAAEVANKRYQQGTWPKLYFMKEGQGKPSTKRYLKDVKQGRVPSTFFEDRDSDDIPFLIESQSWAHTESGHTDSARKLLDSILGQNHSFTTPKPVMLFEKIIQIWCPPEGTVLDAFAGSGTTAHAVLHLNKIAGANRKFILIECGQGDDKFCGQLTAERVRRVINGKWADGLRHEKYDAGFTYLKAGRRLGKTAIMQAQREELADIILQATPDSAGHVDCRFEEQNLEFIIGKTRKGEAIALIWGHHGNIFQRDMAQKLRAEAKKLRLQGPIHIYATVNKGPNGSDWYYFCKIPETILTALGIQDKQEQLAS